MAQQQQRRVALVTGGSRGIGLGIAKHLAHSGFDLAINGRRKALEITEAMAELESAGAAVEYCQADISDAAERGKMIETVQQRFGRLDVLVNNAGVAPDVRADLLDTGEESFDRLIEINLKGPFFLTQLAARMMIEERKSNPNFYGAVINVSSVSAALASTNRGEYCISKAGVAMATKLWAMRLAEYGVSVFEVRPGVIRTDMTAGVAEKYHQQIADGLTLEKRWGETDDVGRAVAVLARGELTYATGNVLMIDGGMTVNRL